MINRINYITNLKFIGIIAVVWGHFASPFSHFIYSWHMPLFFILSTMIPTSSSSFPDEFKKNFKRLIIPALIYCLIGISLECLKRHFLNRDQLTLEYVINFFTWLDYKRMESTYAFPLWFLFSMFWAKSISYFFKIHPIIIFLSSLILAFAGSLIELPLGIDNAINVLVYLGIGYCIQKYDLFKFNNKIILITSIIALTLIYFIFNKFPTMDISNKYYDNFYVNIIWATSIFLTLAVLTKNLKPNQFVNLWANNTITILAIHIYTNNISNSIIEKIAPGFWPGKFLLTLLFIYPVLLLKNKFSHRKILKYV